MREVPTWPEHVSPSGRSPGVLAYRKDGCRCRGCKAGAHAAYEQRKPQGTRSLYGRARGRSCYVATGGRCGHQECLEANREYQRNWQRVQRGGLDLYEDITDV